MKYTIKDFMKEFKHLSKFYNSKKEFKQHLLSGEVKISIPDMIEIINKQQEKYAIDFANWITDDEVNDLIIVGELNKNPTIEELLYIYKNK